MTDVAAPVADLICVPPRNVRRIWPAAAALIEAGYAAADLFMPVDIEKDLANGLTLLWIAAIDGKIVGAMTTALQVRPSGKVCKMIAAGGDSLEAWKDLHTVIEQYAKAEGCCKMIVEGRRGWIRALSGYQEVRCVIEKRLTP